VSAAPSLLRRLARDLLVANLVGLAVILALTVHVLHASVEGLERQDLRDMAAEIAGHLAAEGNGVQLALPPAFIARFSSAYGRYMYLVVDDQKHVLLSSADFTVPLAEIDPAAPSPSFFHERHSGLQLLGVTVGASVAGRPAWVQVAENLSHRDVLLDDINGAFIPRAVLWLAGFDAVFVGLIVLGMKLRLQPLLLASERAAGIGPQATGIRLPEQGIPAEILPLVAAVNGALARIDQAFRAQKEFLEHAAHELQTPLAILRTRVETTMDAEARRPLIDDIAIISRAVTQLLRVAELDGLVIQADETVDLAVLARAVADYLAPLARREGKTIAVRGERSLVVHGNTEALGQAINNMAENALYHTPAGTEVEISLAAAPAPTVRVRDHGPGIAPHERNLIFQRFWRRDRRQGGGAGLGLSIVSRAVELHHGTIAVDDAPGGGALFTMTLPQKGPMAA
jgi:signal transduction histidine kinase